MDKYEVTCLAVDESVLQKDTVSSLVKELGGTVVSTKHWGQKTLAYPIKKQTAAFYATLVVEMPADKLKKLDRALRIDQSILRALIVKGVYEMKIAEHDEKRAAGQKMADAAKAAAAAESASKIEATAKTETKTIVKKSSVAKADVKKAVPAKPKEKSVSDEERLAQLEGKLKDLLKN